ncbi:MAG: hypothetical protein FWG68_06245, partial [Defluviitaleaceae bacterium]|nr:hypothetical protein [Defluviitaleaceae bacterium]
YGDAYCRGDRPRSPVRLIPNGSIKVYAGGRSPVRLIPNGSIKVYADGATVPHNLYKLHKTLPKPPQYFVQLSKQFSKIKPLPRYTFSAII